MLELRLHRLGFPVLDGPDRYPVPGALQKLADHPGVQRMAGLVRYDMADDRHARQEHVADEVEDLVPHEFILVPQTLCIDDRFLVKRNRVLQLRAPGQSVCLQGPDVAQEPEGARA